MALVQKIYIMVIAMLVSNCVMADQDPFQRFLNQGKKATTESSKAPTKSPFSAWKDFLEKAKEEERKKLQDCPITCPAGPKGAGGPPGPPGLPGKNIAKADVIAVIREVFEEYFTATEKCGLCVKRNQSSVNIFTYITKKAQDHLSFSKAPIAVIPSAFHMELHSSINIDHGTRKLLTNYVQPSHRGAFMRGNGVDVKKGLFIAPYSAIYRFSGLVHLHHSISPSTILTRNEHVTAYICIDFSCTRNRSIKYVSGISPNSRQFTLYADGILYVEAGHTVGIYVENISGHSITVQQRTSFSGHLVGA
ncbi:Adipolin [Trichoplax sp. H2]|nr:Adipolin [Trichoplax sp. H2]|eukprot:RDD43242.1 Adipolin [Trichoplax sp. H2]